MNKITAAPNVTIRATVTKPPYTSAKVASVAISADDRKGDAKAFLRAPLAMRMLAELKVGDELDLIGHWEPARNHGYWDFILNDDVQLLSIVPAEPVVDTCNHADEFYKAFKNYCDECGAF